MYNRYYYYPYFIDEETEPREENCQGHIVGTEPGPCSESPPSIISSSQVQWFGATLIRGSRVYLYQQGTAISKTAFFHRLPTLFCSICVLRVKIYRESYLYRLSSIFRFFKKSRNEWINNSPSHPPTCYQVHSTYSSCLKVMAFTSAQYLQ